MTALFDQPVATAGTSGFVLRPYQQEQHDAVLEAFKTARSVLMVSPTGTGKTITFAHVIRSMPRGVRTLVFSHRDRIIEQSAEKIRAICACDVEIEMADSWADEHGTYRAPVVVASVQSLNAGRLRRRMERFRPSLFGLVIIDEAHHAPAATYKRVIEHFSQNMAIRILGCTATPDRADEAALGRVFEVFTPPYEPRDAVLDGWLVPVRNPSFDVYGLDFSGVGTVAGDLHQGQLAEVVENKKIELEMMSATIDFVGDRQTLVFAVRVEQAKDLCNILNDYRPGSAEVVHRATPRDDRRRIFSAFESQQIQFLANVGIVSEGVDLPGIECISMCRPTKSRALYAQMLGRGSRPLPGIVDPCPDAESRRSAIAGSAKPFLDVLDFVGNAGKHSLCNPVDVLGGNYDDEVLDLAKLRVRAKPGSDVLVELDSAAAEIHARREAERKRRRAVTPRALYTVKYFDPFDALDIEPERERGWHRGRILTDKMVDMLRRNRINPAELTYTHAQQIIREIIAHPEKLPCTKGQANLLKRFGYDPGEFNKASASECIDKLAQNGWKR